MAEWYFFALLIHNAQICRSVWKTYLVSRKQRLPLCVEHMSANKAVKCSVYKRTGLLHISKAQGKALTGIMKISHQESNVKGVGVWGVYHNTLSISEDRI